MQHPFYKSTFVNGSLRFVSMTLIVLCAGTKSSLQVQ